MKHRICLNVAAWKRNGVNKADDVISDVIINFVNNDVSQQHFGDVENSDLLNAEIHEQLTSWLANSQN